MTRKESVFDTLISDARIDKGIRILTLLIIVSALAFGWYYYQTRYASRPEPNPYADEIASLEEQVKRNPNNVDMRLTLARAYLTAGENEGAEAQATQALSLSPDSPAALFVRGEAHMQMGNYAETIADFERIDDLVQTTPALRSDPNLAYIYFHLGELYRISEENGGKAEAAYLEALTYDSSDADSHLGLGMVYQEYGEHETAISHFEDATLFVPNFIEAYQAMAASYSALEDEAGLAYAQGMTAYVEQDFNTARQLLERSAELNPDSPGAFVGLALVFEKTGLTEDALAAAETAVEIDENNFLANYLLKRLTAVEPESKETQ